MDDSTTKYKVYVRVCPDEIKLNLLIQNSEEIKLRRRSESDLSRSTHVIADEPSKAKGAQSKDPYCIDVYDDDQTIVVKHPPMSREKDKVFQSDKVFNASTSQDEIFETIQGHIDEFLSGADLSVITYGAVKSGKSFTMNGNKGYGPGIVTRSIDYVFFQLDMEKEKVEHPTASHVEVTFVELYNNNFVNLLGNSGASRAGSIASIVPLKSDRSVTGSIGSSSEAVVTEKIEIHESASLGVFLSSNLPNFKHEVTTSEEALKLFHEGNQWRSTRIMDKSGYNSSRGHAIFTIYLEKRKITKSETDKTLKSSLVYSRLQLVDLAGTDRFTGKNNEIIAERHHINTSLNAFGDCLHAMCKFTQKTKNSSPEEININDAHIPFMNSKLTRLLKNSMSLNGKIVLFATIQPDWTNMTHTVQTLKYATWASKIKGTKKLQKREIDTSEVSLKEEEEDKQVGTLRTLLRQRSEKFELEVLGLNNKNEQNPDETEKEKIERTHFRKENKISQLFDASTISNLDLNETVENNKKLDNNEKLSTEKSEENPKIPNTDNKGIKKVEVNNEKDNKAHSEANKTNKTNKRTIEGKATTKIAENKKESTKNDNLKPKSSSNDDKSKDIRDNITIDDSNSNENKGASTISDFPIDSSTTDNLTGKDQESQSGKEKEVITAETEKQNETTPTGDTNSSAVETAKTDNVSEEAVDQNTSNVNTSTTIIDSDKKDKIDLALIPQVHSDPIATKQSESDKIENPDIVESTSHSLPPSTYTVKQSEDDKIQVDNSLDNTKSDLDNLLQPSTDTNTIKNDNKEPNTHQKSENFQSSVDSAVEQEENDKIDVEQNPFISGFDNFTKPPVDISTKQSGSNEIGNDQKPDSNKSDVEEEISPGQSDDNIGNNDLNLIAGGVFKAEEIKKTTLDGDINEKINEVKSTEQDNLEKSGIRKDDKSDGDNKSSDSVNLSKTVNKGKIVNEKSSLPASVEVTGTKETQIEGNTNKEIDTEKGKTGFVKSPQAKDKKTIMLEDTMNKLHANDNTETNKNPEHEIESIKSSDQAREKPMIDTTGKNGSSNSIDEHGKTIHGHKTDEGSFYFKDEFSNKNGENYPLISPNSRRNSINEDKGDELKMSNSKSKLLNESSTKEPNLVEPLMVNQNIGNEDDFDDYKENKKNKYCCWWCCKYTLK